MGSDGRSEDDPGQNQLTRLASKYVWWKTPAEALVRPDRVIAQIMNIGDFDDVQILVELVGDDVLRNTLVHAEIGQFSERSWAYWHFRLGLASVDQVPPIPTERFRSVDH